MYAAVLGGTLRRVCHAVPSAARNVEVTAGALAATSHHEVTWEGQSCMVERKHRRNLGLGGIMEAPCLFSSYLPALCTCVFPIAPGSLLIPAQTNPTDTSYSKTPLV